MTAHLTPITRSKKQKAFASLEAFELWLSKQKTDYNYEFVSGIAIKKPAMKQNEIFIVSLLLDFFMLTETFKSKGKLLPETDVYINESRKRIPDLAYFSAEQIKETRKGIKVVPSFVIELLSDSEGYADVQEKIEDYFWAGVQVVWYINPKTEKIHLYNSAKTMQLCAGDDLCTAAPAIPDFQLVVKDLFVKDED